MSEKVIVRLEDLVKWTVPDFSGWAHCLKAEPLKPSVLRELGTNGRREALHRYRESTLTSGLNFKDVQRERAQLGERLQKPQFLKVSFKLFLKQFLHFKRLPQCLRFLQCRCVECLHVCVHKSAYVYGPLVDLTSFVSTGVIHQCVVGVLPDIMS